MSFDIFLQSFSEVPEDRSQTVGKLVLAPVLDAEGANVVTSDGSAAVYGAGDVPLVGLMFNHIAGDLVWDVVFDAAVTGDWVIMPVGGPLCLVRQEQAASLPDDLKGTPCVIVRSGKELHDVARL